MSVSQHLGVERTQSVCQFGPGDVRKDGVGDLRDRDRRDDLQGRGFSQQRLDGFQVVERLGGQAAGSSSRSRQRLMTVRSGRRAGPWPLD
jgi:hypothetical protein